MPFLKLTEEARAALRATVETFHDTSTPSGEPGLWNVPVSNQVARRLGKCRRFGETDSDVVLRLVTTAFAKPQAVTVRDSMVEGNAAVGIVKRLLN